MVGRRVETTYVLSMHLHLCARQCQIVTECTDHQLSWRCGLLSVRWPWLILFTYNEGQCSVFPITNIIIHEHLLPSVNNIKPMTSMANIPLWNENIVIFFTKRLKMLCFTVDREQHGTKTSCVQAANLQCFAEAFFLFTKPLQLCTVSNCNVLFYKMCINSVLYLLTILQPHSNLQ